MVRSRSNWKPLDVAFLRQVAETVRKAHAVGLLDDPAAFTEVSYATAKEMVLQVREAGIGAWAADDFVRTDPADTASLTRDLRELDALLEDSPLPTTEWPRLLSVFERDQLARLVGISPSSVNRYERGERRTPDDVAARLHFLALVVGDLIGAYNDIGIRRWFDRKRTVLEGRAPANLLMGPWQPEDEGPRRVRDLARALISAPAT